MEFNTHFIPQNVSPYTASKIGVYKKSGKKMGYIYLDGLILPDNFEEKGYSFGIVTPNTFMDNTRTITT